MVTDAGRRGHAPALESDVVRRIAAEFQEMPGLVLSLKQASLLLGVDESACARILGDLADQGVLRRRGTDAYARKDTGA